MGFAPGLFLVSVLSLARPTGFPPASPPNSSVDPCLILCPLSDIAFHVTVRDLANSPIANSVVMIDFCPVASSVHQCFVTSCTVSGVTNVFGQLTLSIAGGGVSATQVEVRADGVLLATRPVASTDQNGDLTVNGADLAIGTGKLGLADPTMDLDCDQGVVDQADVAVMNAHLGHSCGGPTPARPRSWGRVKQVYR